MCEWNNNYIYGKNRIFGNIKLIFRTIFPRGITYNTYSFVQEIKTKKYWNIILCEHYWLDTFCVVLSILSPIENRNCLSFLIFIRFSIFIVCTQKKKNRGLKKLNITKNCLYIKINHLRTRGGINQQIIK